MIEQAAAQGTSAVVLRVLEAGALAGISHPHPGSALARSPSSEFDRNVERARALGFLVRDGQTLAQAAIRFALAQPTVSVVLVGFSAPDQVEEAARASASADRYLSADDLARIEDLYRSDFGLRQVV